MSKATKVLGILLSLIAVAAAFLTFLFDPNDYRDELQARFAAATGYELVIDGQLRAIWFPRPALEITESTVTGESGRGGPSLVEIDSLRIYPRLLPLIGGRVEFELIRVEGLLLQLISGAQGSAGQSTLVEERAPAEPASSDQSSVVRPPARLQLQVQEMLLGPIAAGKPIDWHLSGTLRPHGDRLSAELRAEGSLLVGEDLQSLHLEPLIIGLEKLDLGNGNSANLLLRADMDADLSAGRYLAEEATLEIQATGVVPSGEPTQVTAVGRLELKPGTEQLKISDLSVRSGPLSATGSVLGQTLLSAPVVTGDLIVNELDLRTWLDQLGVPMPETVDATTFRRFSLTTCWRLDEERIDLHDLVLDIDETQVWGDVERVSGSPAGYRFDLLADQLDLDSYLPPAGLSNAGQDKTSQQRAPVGTSGLLKVAYADPASIPTSPAAPSVSAFEPELLRFLLDTIQSSDLEGRLRVGALKLAGLRFGDADLRIRSEEGRLKVANRVSDFYEGRLAGAFGLDLSGSAPSVALTQSAREVQTGLLLKDLIGEDRFRGRGEFAVDLAAAGRSAEALQRSLGGELSVHIPEGAINEVSLERIVREAEARLRGTRPPEGLPQETGFRDLRATGEIRDGVLSNRDLFASSDYVRITGAGTLDLVQGLIDYRLEPMFIKPPKGRGIKELEGVPIPVLLTGPIDFPEWRVDIGSALATAAARRLDEQDDDLFGELEERTGIRGLEEGLKNLFGR